MASTGSATESPATELVEGTNCERGFDKLSHRKQPAPEPVEGAYGNGINMEIVMVASTGSATESPAPELVEGAC